VESISTVKADMNFHHAPNRDPHARLGFAGKTKGQPIFNGCPFADAIASILSDLDFFPAPLAGFSLGTASR
jgi:hypothetical protein